MNYLKEDYIFDEYILDNNECEWLESSIQTIDSVNYMVYRGLGDNSLVKLLINQEIVTEI